MKLNNFESNNNIGKDLKKGRGETVYTFAHEWSQENELHVWINCARALDEITEVYIYRERRERRRNDTKWSTHAF